MAKTLLEIRADLKEPWKAAYRDWLGFQEMGALRMAQSARVYMRRSAAAYWVSRRQPIDATRTPA